MGDRRIVNRVLVGKPEARSQLEDSGTDARIILKFTLEKWVESMDWIDLDQDRGRWLVPVNSVMNLRVLKKMREIF
jgi:hypothetical protein